jgi:hypothetical protein
VRFLVWLCLACFGFILVGCGNGIPLTSEEADAKPCSKQIEVLGLHVYATAATPDDKMRHAAAVLAEYLDNDEDGVPDNRLVYGTLANQRAAIVMDIRDRDGLPPGVQYGLHSDEVVLNAVDERGNVVRFDTSWEEILHMITDCGYGVAYPAVFGRTPGTALSNALDAARGGRFKRVPRQYPPDAWFTYDDRSCDYDCQNSEYIYWALTSILGAQDGPGRYEDIGREWRLNTKEKVRTHDPAIYALLTDPQYRFPTVLPDGNYRAAQLTVRPYP